MLLHLKMLQGGPDSSLMLLCCMLLHLKMLQNALAIYLHGKYADGVLLHSTEFEDATKGPGSRSWDRLAEAIPYGIGLFYSLPSSHTL